MSMLPPRPPAIAPIRWLAALTDWSIVAIGALMIFLVFFNVVAHIVGRDNAWTIEMCELLMVWVTFLGGAAASYRGAHMSITEFLDKLAPSARRYADALVQLVCCGMLLALLVYGWGLVQSSWGNVLTVLDIPMAIQYLALPVGAAGMLVFSAHDLVLTLCGRTRLERYGEQ